MRGINPEGNIFVAEKICPFQLPKQPEINFLPNVDTVSAIVASGPFTTSDNLDYQPLIDLIEYTVEHEPDVLILVVFL